MRTKAALFKVFVLALVLGALSASCSEDREVPVAPSTRIIRYSADVSEAPLTRATSVDYQYRFEAGDKLYVVNTGTDAGKLYGYLTLVSGAGQATAHFEGDLYCEDEFEPLSSTPVAVTLVGPSDSIHLLADPSDENRIKGKIYGTFYPDDEYASTFAEAVEKYSDFTGTGTFGGRSFTLSQHSTFLVFNVRLKSDDVPADTQVSATLVSGASPVTLWSGTVTAAVAGRLSFVTAFAGGTALSAAELQLSWTDALSTARQKAFDDISDQTLAANNYYTVSRSDFHFDGFRIRAKENGTKVYFYYTDGSVLYSKDNGETWDTPPTQANGGIELDGNEEACFKANPENPTRTDCDLIGPYQLFTTNGKLCYIAGNITSLLADPTQFAANAFRSAFSNGTCVDAVTTPAAVTWVDIDEQDPLILPSFTSSQCYREMFRNCTSLTYVPALPATTVASGCYWNMFRDCIGLRRADNITLPATSLQPDCYRELFRKCTNLESIPILPASTLVARCYQQMLSDCNKLTSIVCLATNNSGDAYTKQWVSGITNSDGTFYKAPGTVWQQNGTNGCPKNWGVEQY